MEVPESSSGKINEEDEQYQLAQIKQYPSRLEPKPIGSMVRRLMSRKGYGQLQASADLENAWLEAAAGPLASCSRVGNISRGVLQVVVSNSTALQELHLSKKSIVAKLQQLLPLANIRDLKGRVGKIN